MEGGGSNVGLTGGWIIRGELFVGLGQGLQKG